MAGEASWQLHGLQALVESGVWKRQPEMINSIVETYQELAPQVPERIQPFGTIDFWIAHFEGTRTDQTGKHFY
jgi:hypothetical protein